MTDWVERYLGLARYWADECVKDPDTRVGAVLVGLDRKCIALGYNGFPPGIEDSDERLGDRALKNKLMQHAERNCLDNARFSTYGAAMYVTEHPCLECAKSIISKGVSRVVCPSPPAPLSKPGWRDDAAFGADRMREAGVKIEYVNQRQRVGGYVLAYPGCPSEWVVKPEDL
jgi:dCMP deaminase